MMLNNPICNSLQNVQQRIEAACRKSGREPGSVKLVAVSKTKPIDDIREAIECGQIDFGENKVQELTSKMEQLRDKPQWHMIGTLQTNKIKYLVSRIDWIHSVSKVKALRELESRASNVQRKINVLIQVNISNEEQKSGCEAGELNELLSYASDLKWVEIRGLMGIASFEEDPEMVRPQFRLLHSLRDESKAYEAPNVKLEHLSMGMTHDFEIAIEEGATIVRIGSAIFGERNY